MVIFCPKCYGYIIIDEDETFDINRRIKCPHCGRIKGRWRTGHLCEKCGKPVNGYFIESPYCEICWGDKRAYRSVWGRPLDEAELQGPRNRLFRIWENIKSVIAMIYNTWGISLAERGKFKRAEWALQKAIWIKPDYFYARYNLGKTLLDQCKYDTAEFHLKVATYLKPDNVEAYHNYGIVLGKQGKHSEAEAVLLEAVKIKPDYAKAYSDLGTAFVLQGKYLEAEGAYRELVRLMPESIDAHNYFGTTLGKQGKFEEAEGEFRKAIDLNPKYPEAFNNLAVTLDNQGKRKEARVYWEKSSKVETRAEWIERIKKRLAEPD